MKIAYVLHQYLPFYNSGTEQYVHHLAKKLEARGEEVRIFCFEANFERNRPYAGLAEDIHDGLSVTRVSGWPGLYPNYVLSRYYNPFYGKLFGEFLREEGIEVVHFFQNSYLGVALLEEAAAAGIPFAVNLMDFWYLCPRVQLLKDDGALCDGPATARECITCLAPHDANYGALLPFLSGKDAVPLEEAAFEVGGVEFLASSDPYQRVAAMGVRPHFLRRTLELADEVISPSAFVKELFVKNGYRPDRIRIVAYGVEKEALKGRGSPPAEGVRVGYMGTIAPHKGLHVLVRAFRDLEAEGVTLHVHGDLEAFPDYVRRVKEVAGGDERIRFHGRFEASRLPEVLDGIDVLVVPSLWYENTPFVVLEALASGTPVIGSDLGGLSELIHHGENGLLFPAGDGGALGKTLREIAADPGRLAALRPDPAAVRSLDENVDDFLGIYRDLVSGKKAGPERKGAMDANPEALKKRCELLSRQTHYLTSQVFHMIRLTQGYTRRIAELERVVDDKIFLADHESSETEREDVPADLSPSIRRRLIQLEQVKAVLRRRNELVAELERQLELQRDNTERMEEAVQRLREELEERQRALDELEEHARFLTEVVNRWWNNPVYKLLARTKRLILGGRSG